jgi:Ca-activated chloride channel family protein
MTACRPRVYRTCLVLLASLSLFPLSGSLRAQHDRSADTTRHGLRDDRSHAPSPVSQEKGLMPSDAAMSPASGASLKSGGSAVQQSLNGAASARFNGSMRLESTFGAGKLGATIGGAKDIGYARQLINGGMVPRFVDFSPEGLYSEHDIPTPASDCDEPLCLSLGYGYAPTVDDRSNALFVHLGLGSNIGADQFKRTPLQLAVVVDRSGSMSGNIESVKSALHKLAAKLTPEDRIVLVQFDDTPSLLLPPTSGADRAAILAAVDGIYAQGGTNVGGGMKLGFEQLAALPSREGTMKRLMLFTDEQPNAGMTDADSFIGLVRSYGAQKIGMTLFGVGFEFGQELAYQVSQVRGANFFFLDSPARIASVFDTEFDYLVTPLAYDLKVRIATPQGLKLKAVYGLPTWKEGSRDAELEIPTVFLSSNRGAIILRYEKDGDGPLALKPGDMIASGTLSYTDVGGREHDADRDLRHAGTARLSPGTQFYTHDGMRMAVALTNIYFGLRDGCTLLTEGKRKEALDVITRAKGAANIENAVLQDAGLDREIKMLDKLAENIERGEAVRRDLPVSQE